MFAMPLIAVGAVLSLWSVPRAGADAPAAASPPDARTVYLRDCATCHGSEGRGTTRGPVLVGVGRASIDYMVSTGRMPIADPGTTVRRHRPAYRPALRRELVDYAAALGPGGPDIPVVNPAGGDLARGGELFRLQCAACHAWAGDGGALLRVAAPPTHPATPTQVAEAIRVGPGTMPVFGSAALSDGDVDSVVAYVKDLDRTSDRGGSGLGHLGPLAEGAVAWVVGVGLLMLAVRWIGERM